jgi:hypothetical protein
MFTRPKFNIDRGWEVTDTITDIIAIYLDPNSYVPAHHAALQIDDLRPDRRMHEDGEEVESLWGFIGSLWDCILEIAQEVHQSDMRRRLVQLAEALYMTDTTLLEVYRVYAPLTTTKADVETLTVAGRFQVAPVSK